MTLMMMGETQGIEKQQKKLQEQWIPKQKL